MLLPQLEALLEAESDLIANMANMAAVLHENFENLWTGFYLWKEDSLVLGPFQGPLACTRIQMGKGVCGSSFERKESIIVPNVDEFPGHIACSSESRSEIVVPMYKDGKGVGVLDIDSKYLSAYDEVDQQYLEKLVEILLNCSK